MKSLYDEYKKFEELAKNKKGNIIELDESLFKPSIITPLINYSKNSNVELKIDGRILDESLINQEEHCNYIEFPFIEEDRKGEIVKSLVLNLNHEEYCGLQTIIYIFNELVSNVLDHSSVDRDNPSNCYIFTEEYPKQDLLDISIMDSGISIPGNFEYHNIEFLDDCDAISKAVNQVSTQTSPYDSIQYSRGFGLWSTLKLVIEGNLGNALIVSRNGCLNIADKYNHKYYNLTNSNIFNGTLVSLRLKKAKIENFYNLIEINESNSYRYRE